MNILKTLRGSQILCHRSLNSLATVPLTSSYVKGDPFNDPVELSTAQVLLNATQKNPQKIALYCYDQQKNLTFEDLTIKAVKLANTLVNEFKMKPKDRVGVYSFNKWEWYVLQLACAFADLILVNINPSYRSQQLAYTLDKVRVNILFLSDSFRKSDYLEILRNTVHQIRNETANAYDLQSSKFGSLRSVVRMNAENDSSRVHGFVNYTDLFHSNYSLENLPKMPSCFDQANIQFTSGTTGQPKAAVLSHYNILNNGYAVGKRMRLTSNDNICVPVPLYHCFGMILGNLAALTRSASLTYICEGFDPKKTMEAVSKYHCTALYGVPTMFSEYLRVYEQNPSNFDIKSLRTGIIAGSLAPEILMQKILNTFGIKEITNCYGMTQTSPVSFQTKHTDSFEHKTQSVGSILEGLEAKIVDKDGNTCPIGTAGEFIVKGWAVMNGYWEDPVVTQKSIKDGWMYSGDVGVFDEQGYLSIVGRDKDMIIRGGENVYPKQIEQFLNKTLHGILDTQVVAVSDEKYGQQICVVVRVADLKNIQITKQDILHACKDQIAHYKIPKYAKFVSEYPLTVTGKIQKFILRSQLQDEKKQNGLKDYMIR